MVCARCLLYGHAGARIFKTFYTHFKVFKLRETTSRRVKRATLLPLRTLELFKMFSVQIDFSDSSSLSLTFSWSFSCRNMLFSLSSCFSWSSRFVTYSFFFLRERQADSRFLIIRCCRFNTFIWKNIRAESCSLFFEQCYLNLDILEWSLTI